MKKTAILCMLTLALGFLIGIFCNYSFVFFAHAPRGQENAGVLSSVIVPAADQPLLPMSTAIQIPPLETKENIPLLRRAEQVLGVLKARDYAGLSGLVHPERGLTFTPYSTVALDGDLRFTPAQIAKFSGDSTHYVWGIMAGKGDPLDLSVADYFDKYVFNADYTLAPQISIDTVLKAGNALENVADVYPGARFVEFHYPGLSPENQGYDWCSLKLVFSAHQNDWKLIGIIHSEWTT